MQRYRGKTRGSRWRAALAACAVVASVQACGTEVEVGAFSTPTTGADAAAGAAGAPSGNCSTVACDTRIYACGDCVDNDGDGLIDSADPDCFGPCQNSEEYLSGSIPGQNAAPCSQDCYFDTNTGRGNDDCDWDHRCDELSVAPDYPPEGDQCPYTPDDETCPARAAQQSSTCIDVCGPLTPNGCDCFGCCQVEGAPNPIWLGSEVDGEPSCTREVLDDPSLCKPCTQVTAPGCINPCDECELCVGKTELPSSCDPSGSVQCPTGRQACGRPGQADCPPNQYCITGCCAAVVR